LKNFKLTVDSIKIITKLPKCLTYLYLKDNQIGDEGALVLAKKLPHGLICFDLSENRIVNEGALALAKNLPKGITIFYLFANFHDSKVAIRCQKYLKWCSEC
jgi:Leucine-rich repeat (LRR) protein